MNLAYDIYSVTPLLEEAVDRCGELANEPDRQDHATATLMAVTPPLLLSPQTEDMSDADTPADATTGENQPWSHGARYP